MNELLPLIDFSKVKKKKIKDDLDDVILTKKKNKKSKKEKNENKQKENEEKEDTGKNENEKFPYDTLLKRLYNLMKKENPNSSTGGLKIPNIQVGIVGKDRSCWMNFEKVANSLNRNLEHLFQYILSELGIEGTIGGENQANFKAKVTQISLQKVLTKYINDYVRCPNCKSFKTILKKDQSTRLQQIFCESCKSEKTVQVIKSRTNAGKKKK